MIPVTKPYLPDQSKYQAYVGKIFDSGQLTNNGPLVNALEQRLCSYLGVKHVICVANGSLALQVAYKALEIEGEAITTPFSFAATSSTLVWEGIKPIYSDIDADTFNLDPALIESHVSCKTSAIIPVHVFGNPCNVEEIRNIANKYGLKVIYDAAHAFGVRYKGESILKYGDMSTLSFHATKLFHTIEGGAIITGCDKYAEKVRDIINFGISKSGSIGCIGTNAKMNEFEAAMGLCVLDDMEKIIKSRKSIIKEYIKHLPSSVKFQKVDDDTSDLISYFPILLSSESALLEIVSKLAAENIIPRRYFYPSLDVIYDKMGVCDISNEISRRILCLPLYYGLDKKYVKTIADIIKQVN